MGRVLRCSNQPHVAKLVDQRPEVAEMHWAFWREAEAAVPIRNLPKKTPRYVKPVETDEPLAGVYLHVARGPRVSLRGTAEMLAKQGVRTRIVKPNRPGQVVERLLVGPLSGPEEEEEVRWLLVRLGLDVPNREVHGPQ